jgi:hypothetical protein
MSGQTILMMSVDRRETNDYEELTTIRNLRDEAPSRHAPGCDFDLRSLTASIITEMRSPRGRPSECV